MVTRLIHAITVIDSSGFCSTTRRQKRSSRLSRPLWFSVLPRNSQVGAKNITSKETSSRITTECYGSLPTASSELVAMLL